MANLETVNNETALPVPNREGAGQRYLVPPTDILENPSEYLLLADMPGVLPDDISIQLEADQLAIEGRGISLDGSPVAYRRVFQVGPGIDSNGISAELKQGVLHLVAKKSEAVRPRQIAVKAG